MKRFHMEMNIGISTTPKTSKNFNDIINALFDGNNQ